MAKKKAKKNPNQVVVKVTGTALPSRLCLAAGHAIGTVEARLNHLNYELRSGTKASEVRESAESVAIGLGMIAAQFPLTEKSLKSLRDKFHSRTLKDAAMKEAVRETMNEIQNLKAKAQQGCQ